MFGRKKNKKPAATVASVVDADVRSISVDWDDDTTILTVSDTLTGDLVAASHGDAVIIAAPSPAVLGIHFTAPHTVDELDAALAALKMVGISQIISARPDEMLTFLG